MVTWPVAGILMETLGWAYAFYVPAVFTFFLTIIWFYVVSDSPAQHPRIRVEEKEYIEKAIGHTVSNKKVRALLTNLKIKQLTEINKNKSLCITFFNFSSFHLL